MPDISAILAYGGTGAVITFIGNAAIQWASNKSKRDETRITADMQIEQHRDQLTLDMLSAVRTDLTAARMELADLRPLPVKVQQLESRLVHLDEALDHIERIIRATTAEERGEAERQGKAFVNRMRRLTEAQGTMANEAQIAFSQAQHKTETRAEFGDVLRQLNDIPGTGDSG